MPLGNIIGFSINAAIERTPMGRTEAFENTGYGFTRLALVSILTAFFIFMMILFVGKFLWNNVLHELVPAIKPADSVWQIMGLAILIMLLNPG